MQLAIMRHGNALEGQPDASRALSAKGNQEVAATGKWLAHYLQARSLSVNVVSSPYLRAQQSAKGVEQVLCSADIACENSESCLITPDGDYHDVIDWLLAEEWHDMRLLVSHMPIVSHLTASLVEGVGHRGYCPYATAEIMVLEADVWAAGCARIVARYPSAL